MAVRLLGRLAKQFTAPAGTPQGLLDASLVDLVGGENLQAFVDRLDTSFRGHYASGTTYNVADIVLYVDELWRSLTSNNSGNSPTSNPQHWEVLGKNKGFWNASYYYRQGDMAFYQDVLYISIHASTQQNNNPATDNGTHWFRIGGDGGQAAELPSNLQYLSDGLTYRQGELTGRITNNNIDPVSVYSIDFFSTSAPLVANDIPNSTVALTLDNFSSLVPSQSNPLGGVALRARLQITDNSVGSATNWRRVYNFTFLAERIRTGEAFPIVKQGVTGGGRTDFLYLVEDSGSLYLEHQDQSDSTDRRSRFTLADGSDPAIQLNDIIRLSVEYHSRNFDTNSSPRLELVVVMTIIRNGVSTTYQFNDAQTNRGIIDFDYSRLYILGGNAPDTERTPVVGVEGWAYKTTTSVQSLLHHQQLADRQEGSYPPTDTRKLMGFWVGTRAGELDLHVPLDLPDGSKLNGQPLNATGPAGAQGRYTLTVYHLTTHGTAQAPGTPSARSYNPATNTFDGLPSTWGTAISSSYTPGTNDVWSSTVIYDPAANDGAGGLIGQRVIGNSVEFQEPIRADADIGAQGPTGPSGPRGPTGDSGPAGPTGPAGQRGQDGPQGPQGTQGDTGPAGPAGPTGATGQQGPMGPQGTQGPAGTTATIPAPTNGTIPTNEFPTKTMAFYNLNGTIDSARTVLSIADTITKASWSEGEGNPDEQDNLPLTFWWYDTDNDILYRRMESQGDDGNWYYPVSQDGGGTGTGISSVAISPDFVTSNIAVGTGFTLPSSGYISIYLDLGLNELVTGLVPVESFTGLSAGTIGSALADNQELTFRSTNNNVTFEVGRTASNEVIISSSAPDRTTSGQILSVTSATANAMAASGYIETTGNGQTIPKGYIVRNGNNLYVALSRQTGVTSTTSFTNTSIWVQINGGGSGTVGPQGPQGETGPQGPQGDTGPAGAQGDRGPQGPQGEQGEQGPMGSQGNAGNDGDRGPQGQQGPYFVYVYSDVAHSDTRANAPSQPIATGWTPSGGFQGLSSGWRDSIGTVDYTSRDLYESRFQFNPANPTRAIVFENPYPKDANIGSQGERGPMGLQGEQGPTGAQGETGPQGGQGIQGPAGPTGPEGPQGPAGDTGPAGPTPAVGDGYVEWEQVHSANYNISANGTPIETSWTIPDAGNDTFLFCFDDGFGRTNDYEITAARLRALTVGTSSSAIWHPQPTSSIEKFGYNHGAGRIIIYYLGRTAANRLRVSTHSRGSELVNITPLRIYRKRIPDSVVQGGRRVPVDMIGTRFAANGGTNTGATLTLPAGRTLGEFESIQLRFQITTQGDAEPVGTHYVVTIPLQTMFGIWINGYNTADDNFTEGAFTLPLVARGASAYSMVFINGSAPFLGDRFKTTNTTLSFRIIDINQGNDLPITIDNAENAKAIPL